MKLTELLNQLKIYAEKEDKTMRRRTTVLSEECFTKSKEWKELKDFACLQENKYEQIGRKLSTLEIIK